MAKRVTVVGKYNDNRVILIWSGIQRFQHPPDLIIHKANSRQIAFGYSTGMGLGYALQGVARVNSRLAECQSASYFRDAGKR